MVFHLEGIGFEITVDRNADTTKMATLKRSAVQNLWAWLKYLFFA